MNCLQELQASVGKEQAFSQASSSGPSSPSQDSPVSQGPPNIADSDSKSQKCKEDPDYDWCPAGELLAANPSAAVCELPNVGYILQGPAAQL